MEFYIDAIFVTIHGGSFKDGVSMNYYENSEHDIFRMEVFYKFLFDIFGNF